MNFLDNFFKISKRGSSFKNEIIGGVVTFVAMCYILPVNSSILSSMGMNSAGVFTMTAIVSCFVTLIMALVANYPIVLSAGMGLNAFLAYTLSDSMGFETWHQKMILLTISGIIFFVFSLTPVRKKIIEAIPSDIRGIISASLGGFILLVGLKGSGIIVSNESTIVGLGNFADPAMIIAFVSVIITVGLMFIKNKTISSLAIPIGILTSAIVGVIVSSILIANNHMIFENGSWLYANLGKLDGTISNLAVGPWNDPSLTWGINSTAVKDVFFYGLLSDSYSWGEFGQDVMHILTTPATYVAIFSLVFVKLFDTTATLIAVGEKAGLFDENGQIKDYRKAVLADATGALICAPLGTSTVTSFSESNVGVSLGARTGFAASISALLFLLSAFIYPIFSIFTYGSVTASALIGVGLLILSSSLKNIRFKEDPVIAFTALISIIFAVLTYSISNGIGIGLISYCVMMLFARRGKEIKVTIYVIAALFVISFVLSTLLNVL